MKKLVLIGIFLAGTALALDGTVKVASEVQPSSRGEPDSGSFTTTASLPLNNLKGFRVSICTVAGTPLGGGTLRPYLWNETLQKATHASALNLTIADAGVSCQNFPDQEVVVPAGRLIYATSSVTLDDGGTLLPDAGTGAFTVYYTGWSTP